jgi:hypothetical protein
MERLELPDAIREVAKDEQVRVEQQDLLPTWKRAVVRRLLPARNVMQLLRRTLDVVHVVRGVKNGVRLSVDGRLHSR